MEPRRALIVFSFLKRLDFLPSTNAPCVCVSASEIQQQYFRHLFIAVRFRRDFVPSSPSKKIFFVVAHFQFVNFLNHGPPDSARRLSVAYLQMYFPYVVRMTPLIFSLIHFFKLISSLLNKQ